MYETTNRVLLVDDEPILLESLRRLLRSRAKSWDAVLTYDAESAMARLLEGDVDVVVSDLQMPGMNGLGLLEWIRRDERTREVPVIIVTGLVDRSLKAKALDLGATDLLNKPVDVDDLLARLRNAVRLKSYQDQLKLQNERLECMVIERTKELAASRLEIIWRLAMAAEYRDEETGNHVVRVGLYCRAIALAMKLDADFIETLFLAAPLHDIGKIGVSDSILLKPGKLTEEEWQKMRRHCEIGAAILRQDPRMSQAMSICSDGDESAAMIRTDNPVLEMAARISLTHHEKWDGSGYPRGLSKEEIPLESRILAVADVYDALRSERPYKPPFTHEKALAIIQTDSGSHFDPRVVEAFMASINTIQDIREQFLDRSADPIVAGGSSDSPPAYEPVSAR